MTGIYAELDRHFELHHRDPAQLFSFLLSSFPITHLTGEEEEGHYEYSHGSIVSLDVVVIDMLDREIFVTNGTRGICGYLRDDVIEEEEGEMKERNLVVGVTVQTRNRWKEKSEKQQMQKDRKMETTEEKERKRKERDESSEAEYASHSRERATGPSGQTSAQSSSSAAYDLNLPVPGRPGASFVLKLYDNALDNIKLCDVLHVVGVVSLAPQLTQHHNQQQDPHAHNDNNGMFREELGAFMDEFRTHMLPTSMAPWIHVLQVTKKECLHPELPLLGTDARTQMLQSLLASGMTAQIRERLVAELTHTACSGDQLAAEYMLLHMLSRDFNVQSRIGYSLNLCGPAVNVPAITDAYKQLTPSSLNIPLSLQFLNHHRFVPQKDYDKNRLQSGILQLPKGTFLLLDETALSEGTLQPHGVRQLAAINHLIQTGEVEYDFVFHTLTMRCDANIAVLSHRPSKILPCDITVRLAAAPADMADAAAPPPPQPVAFQAQSTGEWIESARSYLALIRHLDFDVTPDIGEHIAQDYVQMRKLDPPTQPDQQQHQQQQPAEKSGVDPDTLRRILMIARLRSMSFGESSLTVARWEEAKEMERLRLLRK